ncbi:MAG: hypothetical protein EHM70_22300, partial [Chloroflexota bacterium]
QLSQKLKESLGVELRVHIGLNAGSVIVGGIGSNLLMNYTAIGDTVNLAQRLEDSAPAGNVFVSDSVYRQTQALFDYVPSPTLRLKGIARPIHGHRLIGPKSKPGSVRGIEGLKAPMIGRDYELHRLLEAADSLIQNGRGHFVLITGEAGIGKSRLTSELKTSVRGSSVTVIEGQSLTYRRTVAYWIFLDLLRNYLGVGADVSAQQVQQKLTETVSDLVGQRSAEIIPYLEHLLSLPPSNAAAAERIRFLDASQLRQQIFLAIRDLFQAEARRQPLILILEDLHWADETSLDLLLFLLDSVRQAPLFLLAISRPFQEGIMAKVVDWANSYIVEHFVNIPLQVLSPTQSEQLLFQLLDIPELIPSLRDHILQRAAGIPFYLEEILRMLIDKGMIQREDGRWALSEGVDTTLLGVPDTLEGLILARFDRLVESQRHILQVASVIGRQFNVAVLQMVLHEIPAESIDQALAQLVGREFILPQPDVANPEFAFRHSLMSDAIYKTLLRRDLKELHGHIGEAIESVYANRLEGQIEILARHYSWSPRREKALHYLTLAGHKAARNYANEQARQHYEQALELMPHVDHSPDQAIQLHAGLADVLIFIGEYQAAREHCQSAQSILTEADPLVFIEEQNALKRKIATTYERQGDYDQALSCMTEAQKVIESSGQPMNADLAQIYNDIGWIHFRQGNPDEAERNLVQALGLVENTNRYDVIASIYNRLGGIYYQKNDLEQASNFVRKSLVLREEMGDIVAVARSYNNLGLIKWKQGDWNMALDNLQRSIELNATLGDIEAIILLHLNIGLLQTDRGELDEAKAHLEKGRKDARQIGHSFVEGLAELHLSRFGLAANEWI